MMEKLNQHWGPESEKHFVDGIGTWRENAPKDPEEVPRFTRLALLEKYIEAHEPSPHPWHKAGVVHARKLAGELRRLRGRL